LGEPPSELWPLVTPPVLRQLGSAAALLAGIAALAPPAHAQVGAAGSDTIATLAEGGEVLGRARAAQADFERQRERWMPFRYASGGGTCDEVVGRLCIWDGKGDWHPEPEADELLVARERLLGELDSLQALSPSNGWIAGQRVGYRAEGGEWAGALATARSCQAETWWCKALEGLALHGLGRYTEAEPEFMRALEEMEPERAGEWRLPARVVDSDTRRRLRDLERAGPDSLAAGLARLWRLADPLYLVEGNDRLTAHYARWTVSALKEGARNPFRLRWADDLEELTVRHGWEIGWERSPPRSLGGPAVVTGHRHPDAREYMPSGETFADPSTATAEAFLIDSRSTRSLYAPVYAPVILPIRGQVAVFPRGERMAVVAAAFLPEDTTLHAKHDHPRPWMEPGTQAGLPDRIGLFAVPAAAGTSTRQTTAVLAGGALLLEVPAGAYVLSVESWSPERRLAGRVRMGLQRDRVPPDIAVLSDLLLLRGDGPAPQSLEAALPAVLLRLELPADQPVAVAWEVAGLGFRPETLVFELSVHRTDRSVFRRLGEFLGVSERPPSLALSWEELAPPAPETLFRHLDLALPPSSPAPTRSPSRSEPRAAPTR
jgi:hypothetical protein